MRRARSRLRLQALLGWALLAAFVAQGVAATPKQLLLIHSFGRDFAPYDTITAVFRTELAKRSPERIVIHEATLDAGRTVTPDEERAFCDYLRARFADRAPDLVVTVCLSAMYFSRPDAASESLAPGRGRSTRRGPLSVRTC